MLKKYVDRLNTFDDFYKIATDLTNKEKGDLFEEFTRYLFQFHNYYITMLAAKSVWLYKEIPIKIKKLLNLPDTDQGIDLVILSQYDKYYAVQCKFRSNKDIKIKWDDLGTFAGLTFGIADGFDGAFFVTNTIPINNLINKSNKIIPINGQIFDNLSKEFFDMLKAQFKYNINNVTFEPFKPRNYQNDIITETLIHFENNDRGYIEMACGTGKTLASYWINNRMNNRLTIIAVPSLQLLSQFFNDFSLQVLREKNRHQFILVGSDADVSEDYDEKFTNNGLLVDVDVNKIKQEIEFIIKKYKIDDIERHKLVIITTYQSSDKVIDVLNQMKITPDLCILDEAHKTVGDKNKQFSLLLDDKNLKINKRLFMTATPKMFDGDIENENILSMDDEEWYGKQICLYNTYDAIKNSHLSDYQIVTMYTDNEYINKIIEKNKYVKDVELETSESHYVACAIMLLNAMKEGECTHLVTYHNSIKKAERFQKILESLKVYYDDTELFTMNGKMNMNIRENIIDGFKESKKTILTSARVLNEGVNIPIIDGVCFIDPRTSTIDIVQCIGRALRLYKDKKIAKVFVPTLIENINEIDENKTFGNIIRIIKSMSNTDTGINDYFVIRKEGSVVNRQLIKHKNYLSVEKVGENIDIEEWIDSIDMKIWSKTDGFEYMYQKIKEWIDKNNKIPSKMSKNQREKQLGNWSSDKRKAYKINKLSEDKIKKLEKLNGWFWKLDDPFDKIYDELKKWIDENHRIPSMMSKNRQEKQLGSWSSDKRHDKKEGKLVDDKIKRLEKISEWYWELDDPFNESYNKLKGWIEENKKIPSQTSKNEQEKQLGIWCNSKRQNKKNGKLTEDKIKKLEELDEWYWELNDLFDDKYNELKKWIGKNKKLPSMMSKDEQEKQIGSWCCSRRRDKKKNRLSENKIKKLEKLDGWYWDSNDIFNETYNKLKKWVDDNNKLPLVISKNQQEKQLGIWCSGKRQDKKKGKLVDDKIEKLEQLVGWYWDLDDLFDETYNELKKWIVDNKKLPSAASKNQQEKQLGGWCTDKRKYKKKEKLSEKKIKLLESLPYWYWSKHDKNYSGKSDNDIGNESKNDSISGDNKSISDNE
jgi:superfamily II DNA or RNA helicase